MPVFTAHVAREDALLARAERSMRRRRLRLIDFQQAINEEVHRLLPFARADRLVDLLPRVEAVLRHMSLSPSVLSPSHTAQWIAVSAIRNLYPSPVAHLLLKELVELGALQSSLRQESHARQSLDTQLYVWTFGTAPRRELCRSLLNNVLPSLRRNVVTEAFVTTLRKRLLARFPFVDDVVVGTSRNAAYFTAPFRVSDAIRTHDTDADGRHRSDHWEYDVRRLSADPFVRVDAEIGGDGEGVIVDLTVPVVFHLRVPERIGATSYVHLARVKVVSPSSPVYGLKSQVRTYGPGLRGLQMSVVASNLSFRTPPQLGCALWCLEHRQQGRYKIAGPPPMRVPNAGTIRPTARGFTVHDCELQRVHRYVGPPYASSPNDYLPAHASYHARIVDRTAPHVIAFRNGTFAPPIVAARWNCERIVELMQRIASFAETFRFATISCISPENME